MAKRMKTAAEASAKWASRVQGAGQFYQQGIQNASSWAENAVAASARRDAGLQAAIADGRINAGIQRRGTAGWKTATLAKGPNAWTQSVTKAQPTYEAGMAKAMQFQQAAQNATAGIDTTTRAGRLQKAAVWAETVAQQAEQAKGRM